jgi:hypothetical protein
VEQPERARDDEERPQAAPAHPTDEERPEVLHDLQRGQAVARQRDVHDAPVVHAAAVDDADDPARGGYEVGVVDDGGGHAQERLLLDERVGVHGAHVWVTRGGHARVEGVGLAAVRLVEDPQLRVAARGVGGPHGSAGSVGRSARGAGLEHRGQVLAGLPGEPPAVACEQAGEHLALAR